MMLEVARALTDWFNDGANGVAAKLALVPREGGDPLPDIGTIADFTRDNNVAQMRSPSLPGIAVNVLQIPQLDGENNTVTGDGIADVLVRVARKEADSKIAARDSSYILRALMLSWRAFNAQPRTRNQIEIYACEKLVVAPDWQLVESQLFTGAAKAQLFFRDHLT